MNYRKIRLITSIVLFLLVSVSASLQAVEPGKLIMDTIDKGILILKDPALKGEEKVQERRQKLWEEISPVFNFEEMSKRALGLYWKKCSPEEKKEFVELFTSILKDAYIGKTDTYSGEKIVLIKEKIESNYANVQTRFVTINGTEILVGFCMMDTQEKWKVYDVVIEGVSMVNNYRNQFNSILVKSSYKELVQKIKEKKARG